MSKIIAGINMTIDGVFDHTSISPAEDIHQHYADLLSNADVILYGRISYQLMEYWRTIVKNPTGVAATDKFAVVMDRVPKVVFSRTLKYLDWDSAKLANRSLEDEVLALKKQGKKNILVGSRSVIISLLELNLIDEFQLCVHPVIAGSGSQLFERINDRLELKLIKTKTFNSGAIVLYYEPIVK